MTHMETLRAKEKEAKRKIFFKKILLWYTEQG